tara:strand:- start:121 stop:1092 length:972 start_codon:yes stop_codon:yes gene_type:complete
MSTKTTTDYVYDREGRYEIDCVRDVIKGPTAAGSLANTSSTPTSLEAEWFTQEIKKAFKGCEIRQCQPNAFRYHVYMPEDEYTMGWISIDTLYAEGIPIRDITYTVYSRDIHNRKFDSSSSGFRKKLTTRRNTALKNALTYLRRFSHEEVIHASIQDYRRVLANEHEKIKALSYDAYEKLFGIRAVSKAMEDKYAPILKELYLLLDSGHTFIDASFPDNLASLRSAKEILDKSAVANDLPAYGIRQRERMGQQVIDVCFIESLYDVTNYGGRGKKLRWDTHMYEDTLPEGVLGKLSTLSMCEDSAYIPRVGYRHSEAVFYVTV